MASRVLLEGMRASGLQVANVAARDLLLGPEELQRLEADLRLQFLSANIYVDGKLRFRPYIVLQKELAGQLVALMENRQLARDAELPATGVPLDWERVLSAIQIRANGYGTRATSVLTVRSDGLAALFERSYDTADPDRCADRHYEFMIDRAAEPVGRLKAPRSQ